MQKNKICIITTGHAPFDDRIFHKECKTLVKANYEVMLIATHTHNEVVDGIKIISLPKARSRIHRISVITFKAFWLALKQKADVYHFHDPDFLPAGILLKLFAGSKIIYDVHEDYGKQILYKPYSTKMIRRAIAILTKCTEYVSSKFFAAIITATDDIKNNFSYHIKSISIKNYPILSYFSDTEGKDGDNKEYFKLVYTGALSVNRGIFEMIQSLEYIEKPLKLNLYGNFESDEIEKKTHNLKGFEKVEYFGWIEHENVVKLLGKYNAGLVCLHPIENYKKALPVKLFEYMAAGIPVIASNFSLWKEIVEGNECGICVDPLKPTEIASAIQFYIENPEQRKQMGMRGRKAVIEKYNWDKEGEKLINLYQEVLESDHKTLRSSRS